MRLEKTKLYEEMQFDNYAYATEVKAVAEEQLWLLFCRALCILFLPFFVVRHYKKQAEKNIEAADEYLRFCRPQNAVQPD